MEYEDNNQDNGLIFLKMFRELAREHEDNCISIYVPTSRAGEKVISKHAQKKLKNKLKEIRSDLVEAGMNEKETGSLLKPAEELLEDDNFWRKQSDGLAIFIKRNDMKWFTLPVHFEEKIYIGDHFYLLPLFPFFNNDGEFYLLALSQKEVKLYECSKNYITEIVIDDLIPGSLEDVVGYDYEEKSLQYRTGHGGDGGAMFHGQGRSKDKDKEEIVRYFRAVDKGLMELLADDKKPMVLACVDYYYPVYKRLTAYPELFEKFVNGNPDDEDPLVLHSEAWLLIKDHFRKQRGNKINQFRELSGSDKTAVTTGDVVTASVDGRVDTLFIVEGKDKYGNYDPEKRKVYISPGERKQGDVSLFNFSAINTLLNGGWVYISTEDEMPSKDTEINAILRY
ncbi:MAG: hypothetical protein ACQERS_04905 [Bacteroidota bacterium]